MERQITTKQLNIEIEESVLNAAKSKAYAEGKKLYQWVNEIIEHELESSNPTDQASDLRKAVEDQAVAQ